MEADAVVAGGGSPCTRHPVPNFALQHAFPYEFILSSDRRLASSLVLREWKREGREAGEEDTVLSPRCIYSRRCVLFHGHRWASPSSGFSAPGLAAIPVPRAHPCPFALGTCRRTRLLPSTPE